MIPTLQTALLSLSEWTQPHLSAIALSILATILVIYGDVLNKQLKMLLKAQPFIIRTFVFVLVCAFGYGLLTVYATPFVKQGLNMIPLLYGGDKYCWRISLTRLFGGTPPLYLSDNKNPYSSQIS
jgi:hypothetical protein